MEGVNLVEEEGEEEEEGLIAVKSGAAANLFPKNRPEEYLPIKGLFNSENSTHKAVKKAESHRRLTKKKKVLKKS